MRSLPLAALCLAVLQPASAAGPGAVVGVSTDNVFRGVSESAGDPSVQAGIHYTWDSGALAGVRGASARRRLAYGEQDLLELDAFLGFAFAPVDAWNLRTLWVHYAYPGSNPARDAYDELALDATWLGRVRMSVAASPNWPDAIGRHHRTYDYELSLRWPIREALSLDAGAGYYDLSSIYDTAYLYWSAGASWTLRPLTLGLSWIGADGDARALYGDRADGRVVASALLTF